jgi:hypothetical protein
MANRPGVFEFMVSALKEDATSEEDSDADDSNYVPSDHQSSSEESALDEASEDDTDAESEIDQNDVVEYNNTTNGRDGTIWYVDHPVKSQTPKHNIVHGRVGIARGVGNLMEVVDPFLLFLDENMISKIVQCTNMEGERVCSEKRKQWNVSYN